MEGGKKIKNAVEGNEMDGKNKNNGGGSGGGELVWLGGTGVVVKRWCDG